jgi:hypothetical protein
MPKSGLNISAFLYYSFPEKYFDLESKIYLGASKLKFELLPKSLSGILTPQIQLVSFRAKREILNGCHLE